MRKKDKNFKEKDNGIKISIVIPVYNTAKYLSRCIKSVVEQELKNYEIIIVDDCSTDDSYQMLKDLKNQFSHIKLFQNEKNMGCGFSKNVGLRHCTGKYMCFVDSDDWIKKGSLKKLLELAEETKCDAIYYGEEFRKEGQIGDDNNDTVDELTIKRVYENGIELFENMFDEKKVTVSASHYFIRRDAIGKNISFSENRINDDWIFSALFLCSIKKIIVLENDLYVYYQRTSGNITTQVKKFSIIRAWYDFALCIWNGIGNINEDTKRVRNKCFLHMMIEIHNDFFLQKPNGELEYNEIRDEINKEQEIKVLFEKSKYLSAYGHVCNNTIEEIKRAKNIYVYGAGQYGIDTYRVLYMNKIPIAGFIETRKGKNKLSNVPVYSLKEFIEKNCESTVIIAVSKKYKSEIITLLEENNFINYISLY